MDSYISLEKFKATYAYGVDWSPITRAGIALDGFLNDMLKLAKADIVRECRQNIEETDITSEDGSTYLRSDGNDKWDLVLPNFPVKQVTSCRVMYGWSSQMYNFANIKHTYSRKLNLAGDPVTATCDLMVDRDKGIIHINPSSLTLLSSLGQSPLWQQNFSQGPLAIVISYIYGFATVPLDIEAANGMKALLLAGEIAGGFSTKGAQSVRIGNVNRTWGKQLYESMFARYEKEYKAIVDYYTVPEAYI